MPRSKVEPAADERQRRNSALGRSGTGIAPGRITSLDTLRCFVAAVRTLNFRKAARLVSLGPTAFSARIKTLEDQLGQPLFSRTTRSVALTSAGLALLPAAEQCLEAVARCERIGNGASTYASTILTVGTRQELGIPRERSKAAHL